MFLNLQRIKDALNELESVHPFYGTTFLACKESQLPVGSTISIAISDVETTFLDTYYKPDASSQYFYRVFRTSDKKKHWIERRKYASSTLQSIRTQTDFKNAFLHDKNTDLWGWSSDYVDVLAKNLSLNFPPYRNKLLPAFHLAVWLFRYRDWPQATTPQDVIAQFVNTFSINDIESALFDLAPPEIAGELLQSEVIKSEDLRQIIGSPPDARTEGTFASFPALLLTQNRHKFYFATMPVEDIFPYCFVANRQEDPAYGFQRTLSQERAHDIARYLDQSQGSIPTNIVLSAQDAADFLYNSKNKSIRYRRVQNAFLVLDGQHRLYGYSFTTKHHRVPVAIYEGLTRTEEAKLFIDINTNQRGVPAALLLDIKQVAEQETALEAQLRRLFDRLADDPQSPLHGLLSPAKSATGKISRVTFYKSVAGILKNVVMSKLEENKQYLLLRNYLRAVEQTLQNPKLLRRSAYFEAFCEFFEDVIRLSRERHRDYKETSMREVLEPIGNVDLESLPTSGTTRVSKTIILEVLKNAVSGQIEVTADMV